MHFDFTITFGQLMIFGVVSGGIIRFEVIVHKFLIEHEMLVLDFCKRNGIKLRELPTRSGGKIQ